MLWTDTIVERLKHNEYHQCFANHYFWRSYSKQEVDFIEESGGGLSAYGFKCRGSSKIAKVPSGFKKTYPNTNYSIINRDNFDSFIASP